MFQFRRFPAYAYFIQRTLTEYCSAGLPHSEICGSMCMCHSPQLIAVNHVLLRLSMPRHSLCALLCFTICSFGSSQNFRVQLFVVFFYPTFWLFTFMSLFLLTRSFHLHLLSLFCFQAALFSVLFQEQISTDDLFFIYWYLLLQARHFFSTQSFSFKNHRVSLKPFLW